MNEITVPENTAGAETVRLPLVFVDAYLATGRVTSADQASFVEEINSALVEEDGRMYVALEGCSATTSKALRAYEERCEQFWADLAKGQEPGAFMATRRQILAAQQKDNADLSEVFGELTELPVIGGLVEEVLSPEPNVGQLDAAAQAVGGSVEVSAEGEVVLRVMVDAEQQWYWGRSLGGAKAPGEVAREVVVVARHAKWRDRKVRRLTRVEVYAHELWPS